MARNQRRKKGKLTLRQVAKSQNTGRGWAAGKGVWLPRAERVGSTHPEFFKQLSYEERCTAPECRNPRSGDEVWCSHHLKAAARLRRS